MDPAMGAVRLIRAGLFATAAVGLAATAHVVGGGDLSPGPALLAVPVTALVIHRLCGRRRGMATMLPAMGACQLLLHLTFMAASNPCQVVSPGRIGEAHPGTAHSATAMSMHCGAGMQHGNVGVLPSGMMLFAHAVATLAIVLLLARGEAAIWVLARWLTFHVPVTRPEPLVLVVSRAPVAERRVVRPVSGQYRRNVRRRGPPIFAC